MMHPARQSRFTRRTTVTAALLSILAGAAPGFAVRAIAEDAPAAGWVALRTYTLKDDADRAALIGLTENGFVPLLRGLDGFVACFILQPNPLTWTSVTVWRDEKASAASLPAVKEWVTANVASSIASGPEGFEGKVDIAAFDDALATPAAGTPAPPEKAGWVAFRSYKLKPSTDRVALVARSEKDFVPVVQALDGFIAWYVLQPDPLTWAALTVWRDKAASDAGVAPIREWVGANVADQLEGAPEGFEGSVDVQAFDE